MARDGMNILIGGAAGQGLVTVGQLLAKSLVRAGYFIAVTQNYQSRIRGGHNTFAIRTSLMEVIAPKERIDLLIAFNKETVDLHSEQLNPDSLVVLDEDLDIRGDRYIAVPFKSLTKERYFNIAALGVAGSLLGLDEKLILDILDHFFGKKDASLTEENRKALNAAYKWTVDRAANDHLLKKIKVPINRLMMNGNEAIALGAMSSGVRFASFYPMTPSTSIMLNLAANSGKAGMIVEQAEDEIAAINMALGASFAGVPSMVSTSGGGFALMVEGVSLSAMTETPIVIVVAQRPGPATGLPTGTEQGDLDLVLYSGHGEFPRAIFCPGSVEDCFYLTRKAFEQAENYQGPVFILTDQFLADSYRAISPFKIEELPPITIAGEKVGYPHYERYAPTENGISPRLIPGMTKNLVIADSDEHDPQGHITEDPEIRINMVKKRLLKGEGLKKEVILPDLSGDGDPDILLVSWGSTKGAVMEVASIMRKKGMRSGVLHFSQVWPLVPEHFMETLENAKDVVCVEGNATGQLAALIRKETGFLTNQKLLRYDGLPITPEYILRELERI